MGGRRRSFVMAGLVLALLVSLLAWTTPASVMTSSRSLATPRIPPHELSPTPHPVPSGVRTTPAAPGQGPSWQANLLSGAAGGLLVFFLTVALSGVKDRREAKAAAQVVQDELSAAVTTLISSQIRDSVPLPKEAPAFDTDAFRAYRLLMYRHLVPETMRSVTAAYRQVAGISVGALESLSQPSRNLIRVDVENAVSALNRHALRRRQRCARVSTLRFRSPITFKPPV